MNPSTDRDIRSTAPLPLVCRVAIVNGWLLLVFFVLRTAVLGDIENGVRAFQLAYLTGFAGYGLILWAVLRVHREGIAGVQSGRQQSVLGSWPWWFACCVALRVAVLAVQPVDDVHRYLWEGRIQLAGFNPYVHAPNDPALTHLRDDRWTRINHRDYPAIYPPVAQIIFAGVAAVAPSLYAVKFVHVVADVLALLVLASALKRTGRPPHLAVLYGLCPLVLSAFAIEGHLDSVMVFFVALTTWCVASRRMVLAGVMLGLAIATKLVVVVLLPWFVVRHRRAALATALTVLVCYLPYVGAGRDLFGSLARFGTHREFFSLLGTLGVTSFETRTPRLMVGGILCAVLIVLAWRRDRFADFAVAAMTGLLVLLPVMHYWYLSWVLLFLPFRPCMSWVAASLAMVAYFEAHLSRSLTGEWVMPVAAPRLVWTMFLLVWLIETVVAWQRRRIKRNSAIRGE